MTRLCLTGDTGSGKTIMAVLFLLYYMQEGYKVFSNIHLKGPFENNYTLITDTNFTKVTDIEERNIVLIDEVGKTAYGGSSYNAINLGHVISQSRKSTGEESHFIFTTQIEAQLNVMLKGLTDFMGRCFIIFRYGDFFDNLSKKDKNIPAIIEMFLKVRTVDNDGFTRFIPIEQPLFIEEDFKFISKCYNTYEEVKELGSGENITIKNKYQKYKDFSLSDLAVLIQEKEGKNISESKRLARSIKMNVPDDKI